MIIDRENLQYRLEAMKMAQSSLQQLMTLSAGGLALYFSFIGKAPVIVGAFGTGIVLAWTISLCAAAYAHSLHASLYLLMTRIVDLNKEADALASLPNEVENELKTNPNRDGVHERAFAKIDALRDRTQEQFSEFERSFFPAQSRTQRLTRISLGMLVFGFIELGISYAISTLST